MLHQLCAAVVIQSSWRGYVARKEFLVTREAAVHIQAVWRGWKQKQRYAVLIVEKRRQDEEKRRQDEEKCREEEERRRHLEKEQQQREFEMKKLRELEDQRQKKILQDELEEQKRKEEMKALETLEQPAASSAKMAGVPSDKDTTTGTSNYGSFWDDVDETMAELDVILHEMEEDGLETTIQSDSTGHQKPSELTREGGDDISVVITSAVTTENGASLGAAVGVGKVESVLNRISLAQEEQEKPIEQSQTQNIGPSQSVKSLIAQMQDTSSAPSPQLTRDSSLSSGKLSGRISLFSQGEQLAEKTTEGMSSVGESRAVKRVQSPFLANNKAADGSVFKPSKSPPRTQLGGVIARLPGNQSVDVLSSELERTEDAISRKSDRTPTSSKDRELLSHVTHDQNRNAQAVADKPSDNVVIQLSPSDADEESDENLMSLVLANPDAEFALQDEEVVMPRSQSHLQEEEHGLSKPEPGAGVYDRLSGPRGPQSDLVYSSQLTRSMSPDTLYQLNYQHRYSCVSAPIDGSDRSSNVIIAHWFSFRALL